MELTKFVLKYYFPSYMIPKIKEKEGLEGKENKTEGTYNSPN
jgi:hypothetical protein